VLCVKHYKPDNFLTILRYCPEIDLAESGFI
jgi:hypothetical protein